MIYPLLTWSERKGDEHNFWALAPMIRNSRGPYGRKIHVAPVYYRNDEKDMVASPFYASWPRGADERVKVIPPLLSWQKRKGPERDLWVGAGLFRRRWGGDPERKASHLFPLYYSEGEHTFLTPIYGRDTWGGVGHKYLCTPLVGVFTGDHAGSWLWPLYSHREDQTTGDVWGAILWGTHFRESTRSGSSLWPLYRLRRETNHPVADGVRNGSRLRAGLLFHSDRREIQGADETYRSHGLWPLYSSMNRESGERVEQKRSFLWLLSRSRRIEEPGHESVRHSVLWKLWDYRRDDDTVSIDSFPGITYDRHDDGSTRFSLLRRLYRKETDASGRTKLDVLFIPVKR